MAGNLYITEYARQSKDNRGQVIPTGEEPVLASQKIAFAAASVHSAALNAKTRLVRLHADAICSVKFVQNYYSTRKFTGSAGVSDFDVGNYIYVGVWATATKKGLIIKVSGPVTDPVITYTIPAGYSDFANLDAVKERLADGSADGDGTCTAAAPTDGDPQPEAAATDSRFAASQTEYFGVVPEAVAGGLKIAVIQNT